MVLWCPSSILASRSRWVHNPAGLSLTGCLGMLAQLARWRHKPCEASLITHTTRGVYRMATGVCMVVSNLRVPAVACWRNPHRACAALPQLVLVTEALTGSLRHVTSAAGATAGSGLQRTRGGSSARPAGDLSRGGGGGSASVGTTTPSAALSLTEVKLGLGQLADALTLLHGAAGTAHLSLCPEVSVSCL